MIARQRTHFATAARGAPSHIAREAQDDGSFDQHQRDEETMDARLIHHPRLVLPRRNFHGAAAEGSPNSGEFFPRASGKLAALTSAPKPTLEDIMTKTTSTAKPSNSTTPRDASRVQSATAKTNGGTVPKDSQASRMQRAAVRNAGKSGAK